MLKSLDPLLGPDLLHILASMGHGDEVAVVDANFPAARCARRLVRMDGVAATRALTAVLSILPLDTFVESPMTTMAPVGDGKEEPAIVLELQRAACLAEGREVRALALDREAFYERASKAFAIVQTGEARLYGNVLVRKGVLEASDHAR